MSSSREKGKKKSTFNPAIPPFEGILSSPPPAAQAGPFLPSPVKRPQSNRTTSLHDYTPELDPERYWNQRLIEARKKSSSNGAFTIQLLTTCLTMETNEHKPLRRKLSCSAQLSSPNHQLQT